MAKIGKQVDNLYVKLKGNAAVSTLVCTGLRVRDQFSKIPEMRMEFLSSSSSFDPSDILGTKLTMEADNGFKFIGIVISVEDLGREEAFDLFAAEVRPMPWVLTVGSENRVFQGMDTVEIVKDVLAKAGFTDVTDKTTTKGQKREYCVQYNETNFDFISRLLEEEGIYYFFDHSGANEKLILANSVSAHTDAGTVDHTFGNQVGEKRAIANSIFEWAETGRVVTGKVSLWDYDMEVPSAPLKVTVAMPKGKHAHKSIERYEAGGRYKVAGQGETLARNLVEGFAAASQRVVGATNNAVVVTGAIFTLNHPDRPSAEGKYLVTRTTHYLKFDSGMKEGSSATINRHVERIEFPEGMSIFETEFEVQKSEVQFRPAKVTKWPEVPALLTAKVTGPSGEEIYTDKYGRIKVQFPWDRLGKADETSSVWVRSVMPWAGKDWGMFSVPRIGMEVIIQFERGNIDRPYCTGVVYNAVNKPPYPLPAEMTKTGIRTNSSKGGGGFHELTFDDKKNSETVFFQSEKDYKQVVKNDAVVEIGLEKKDKGDLTQTIHRHKTEVLKTGDLTQTVEDGNRITTIKKDDTEKIDGKQDVTIKGDTGLTITEGNLTETVKAGNAKFEVSQGNMDTKVSLGNITIDASAGKVAITAAQEISLTVGGNSVTIGPAGVTIKGTMIKLEGKAMTEVKGAVVKVAGSGLLEMSGGIVKIN